MKLTTKPRREVSLTVRIQKANKDWISAMANETNRSKAEIMDEILSEHRGSWKSAPKRKTTRGTLKKNPRPKRKS